VAYFENVKTKFANMPNPGLAMAEGFKKGGPEAQAAMQELAKNLLAAKETMSDTDFQALVRDMGFGTLAEELGADALGGMFQKIVDPNNLAKDAEGAVDDLAEKMQDRWNQAWARWDIIKGNFGAPLADVWETVLPAFEKLLEIAEKILPPVLKKLGEAFGESLTNIAPLIEGLVKWLAAEGLVTFIAIAEVISAIFPPITKFLGENAGWLAPILAFLVTFAGLVGTGGAIMMGLSSIASLVAPFLAGGALSAAFAAISAGIASIAAFSATSSISLRLLLIDSLIIERSLLISILFVFYYKYVNFC